jgi:hypothetical protein
MMIHLPGLKLDSPGVMACPLISVCVDCGAARFTVTEAQRQLLRKGIAESFSAAA